MVRICFAGHRPSESVIPLAAACGVGRAAEGSLVDRARWQELEREAACRFRSVPIEAADLVVHPHAYRDSPETRSVGEEARAKGLPCLFFRSADSIAPASPPYGVVYRDSILASRRTPHERAMPALTSDLLRETGGQVRPLTRRPRPSVGFCGYTGNPVLRTLYRLQGRRQKALGLTLRHRTLGLLERDGGVETAFIRRDRFWAGTIGPRGAPTSIERQAAVRREFVTNIIENLYTVCLRGAGNFSYRLYETLSLGRIPLFVNTDCVLPFDDAIDWRSHCVWIEERDLGRVAEVLRDFHDRHTDGELHDLQHANRRLWEEWFRPAAFYRHAIERAMGHS